MDGVQPYNFIGPILNVHAMVNGFIVEVIDDVPDERMSEQPGTIVNHPAWTLSHLNAYAALLLAMLGDSSVPMAEREMERFGYGSTPVRERGVYAPKRELIEVFQERNARLAALVAAHHTEWFPRPAPEKYRAHAPTIGHLAITLMVAHPPHHLGQLKQWRRAAGFGVTR
jgi:hypothetical protein